MHELSVATRIVELIAEQLDGGPGAVRVTRVRVRIGPLSGVVPEALVFAFDAATAGTMLAGAALDVEAVPLVAHCPACDADRELPGPQRLRCPACGGATPDVVSGRELDVVSVEVEDVVDDAGQQRQRPAADR
jgi:hydrogenase nickel incorporation protein HypA/HybF